MASTSYLCASCFPFSKPTICLIIPSFLMQHLTLNPINRPNPTLHVRFLHFFIYTFWSDFPLQFLILIRFNTLLCSAQIIWSDSIHYLTVPTGTCTYITLHNRFPFLVISSDVPVVTRSASTYDMRCLTRTISTVITWIYSVCFERLCESIYRIIGWQFFSDPIVFTKSRRKISDLSVDSHFELEVPLLFVPQPHVAIRSRLSDNIYKYFLSQKLLIFGFPVSISSNYRIAPGNLPLAWFKGQRQSKRAHCKACASLL